MKLTEDMVRGLAEKVLGKTLIEYQGKTIDLSKWERISFAELMILLSFWSIPSAWMAS